MRFYLEAEAHIVNDELNEKLLKEELHFLELSIDTFLLSIEKCKLIGKKDLYSFEEMESFDSLTSKFNRTSDIYIQKVLRTVWSLLHESFVPFIDFMNQGEKLGLIDNADILIAARDLRNQIAHEYLPAAITELVPDVIEYGLLLIKNIETTKCFLHDRHWGRG
jgi:hypothetical protein